MTHASDARRLSRREFGRSTVVATVGASLFSSATQTRASQAPQLAALGPTVTPIRIGSNENPYGVGPAALAGTVHVGDLLTGRSS